MGDNVNESGQLQSIICMCMLGEAVNSRWTKGLIVNPVGQWFYKQPYNK